MKIYAAPLVIIASLIFSGQTYARPTPCPKNMTITGAAKHGATMSSSAENQHGCVRCAKGGSVNLTYASCQNARYPTKYVKCKLPRAQQGSGNKVGAWSTNEQRTVVTCESANN